MLNIWPYHAIGLNLFPHLNVLCSVSLFLQLLHGSFGVLLTPNMTVALLIACFLSARREPCQPFFFGWTRSAKLGVHEVLIDNIIMVNNNGIMHGILILSEKCVLKSDCGGHLESYFVVQKSHRILRKELWEKQLQVLVTNRIGWGPNKSKSNEWCIIWHTFGTWWLGAAFFFAPLKVLGRAWIFSTGTGRALEKYCTKSHERWLDTSLVVGQQRWATSLQQKISQLQKGLKKGL